MPLRDHFRSPLDDVRSWDELHGMWPAVMTQYLNRILPEPYFAGPGVHLGSAFEVDIATFQKADSDVEFEETDQNGSLAVAVAPPKTTYHFEPRLADQDVYEVRIYRGQRDRKLVAAIEIVSPSNKDREDHRRKFISKCAQLLTSGVCVSIIDVVSTLEFNLCGELFELIEGEEPRPQLGPEHLYATTMRVRYTTDRKLLDVWYYPVVIGESLPSLPIWLTSKRFVTLELEATYEECCRTLRIR